MTPMTDTNEARAREMVAEWQTRMPVKGVLLEDYIAAALDEKDALRAASDRVLASGVVIPSAEYAAQCTELSALRAANACLVAGLEHLAKQQTPEEYEEAENDELDADTGLEAYERMVFAARESLARARELLGGKS